MNTPQEQQRIERERRRRMQKKQAESKSFAREQHNDNYMPEQREEQLFQQMTPDEISRQKQPETVDKPKNTFSWGAKPFAAHQWFAILALVFGVVFVFLTPPFQVPDEATHFLKSYSLSEFRFIPQVKDGTAVEDIDTKLTDFSSAFAYLNGHPEQKTSFSDISSWNNIYTSTYNEKKQTTYPTVNAYIIYYLPQTLGMAIARLFGMSVLWTLFMGRLFNLFFYVLMLYLAIKTTPICKNIFFLLALLPMAIFQAASLSYDVMCISVCALFVAEIFDLSYNPSTKFTTQSFVKILILSIVLIFVKTVYFVVVLLILSIPAEKFAMKKDRLRVFALIVFTSVAIYLIITIVRRFIYAGVVTDNSMTMSQILNIIMHPILLLKVIRNTFQTFAIKFVIEFIGKFGWLDVFLPNRLILLYSIGLGGAIFQMHKTEIGFIQNHNFSDTIRLVVLTVIAFIGFTVLLVTAFYYILTLITLKYDWATVAYGIQGRYFIPVAYPAFSALAALINYKINLGDKFYQISKIFNVGLVILSQVMSIAAVATRYYVF